MKTRFNLAVIPAIAAASVFASPAMAAAEAGSADDAVVAEASSSDDAVSFSSGALGADYTIAPVTMQSVAKADSIALAQAGSGGGGAGSTSRSPTYTVTLNQDSFFGFNPSFNGLIPVSDTMDVSFYGTFWTKPAFGLGQGNTGDDLWTEFGVGVNFNLMDGKLKVKPQIGITNGSLLSGGEIVGGATRGARFLDGVVPSLTVNYSDATFEAEYYGGYYAALRQRNGNAALDFAHTWLNFGYKATSNLSFGPHYELLYNTRNTYPGGESAKTYEWLGGYLQFSLPKGFFARFTGGSSLGDGDTGDFYKMSVGMSF
ncbi:DUF6733 family protein [Novosphingobium sp.]|uniref:DUF6733 family protein n=1 Tax=Novosphingobium sp. TaxID=1874826 RepID=UPI00261D4D14|nr:DUF6733 family protein [Novosphingobium sp.]